MCTGTYMHMDRLRLLRERGREGGRERKGDREREKGKEREGEGGRGRQISG